MKGSHGWKSFEVISNLHLTGRYGIHMTFSALDGVLLSRARARLRGCLLGILFISKLVSSLYTEFLYPKPPSSVCGPFSPSQQYTAIQQQQKQDITDKRATRSTDSAGQYRQRRTICPSCLLCDVRRTCATCSSVLPVLSCPLCCTCASKTLRKPVARSTTK